MPGKRRRPATEPKKIKKTKGKAKGITLFFSILRALSITNTLFLSVAISITQRSEEDSQDILNEGFQQLFNGEEPVESMLYRKSSFKKAWKDVNEDINVSAT